VSIESGIWYSRNFSWMVSPRISQCRLSLCEGQYTLASGDRHGNRPSGRRIPSCQRTARAGLASGGSAFRRTGVKRPSTPPSRTLRTVHRSPGSVTGVTGEDKSRPNPKKCWASVAPPAAASPTTSGRRSNELHKAWPSLIYLCNTKRCAPSRLISIEIMTRAHPLSKGKNPAQEVA
jgi:hypothetical protein